MNSQLFASFCDDWFDKDVSNMLIYMNISSNGFIFEDGDPAIEEKYEERLKQVYN